jgi:hypothetical protein
MRRQADAVDDDTVARIFPDFALPAKQPADAIMANSRPLPSDIAYDGAPPRRSGIMNETFPASRKRVKMSAEDRAKVVAARGAGALDADRLIRTILADAASGRNSWMPNPGITVVVLFRFDGQDK